MTPCKREREPFTKITARLWQPLVDERSPLGKLACGRAVEITDNAHSGTNRLHVPKDDADPLAIEFGRRIAPDFRGKARLHLTRPGVLEKYDENRLWRHLETMLPLQPDPAPAVQP